MYLGLALLPWVLLYGVTAILFNHADWLSERAARDLPPTAVPLPAPGQLAAEAEARLGGQRRLVPGSARWVGRVDYRGGQGSFRGWLDPSGRGGQAWRSPVGPASPEWARPLEGWRPLEGEDAALLAAMRSAMAQVPGEVEGLRVHRYPSLRFELEGARRYQVQLDLQGEVEVAPAGRADWRGRLLRLHLTHGDQGFVDAWWLWARVVDLMGLAMVTWALTGLFMWGRMRKLRRLGLLALTSGVLAMLALAAGVLWIKGL